MADFEVIGNQFTVVVRDGHFEETYKDIVAPSPEAAIVIAKERWAKREGPRSAATHADAMRAAHPARDSDNDKKPETVGAARTASDDKKTDERAAAPRAASR